MDDEKAVIDLTIDYTYALDDRRFEHLREIFTADAVGDLAGVHCEGIDEIIDRIQTALTKVDASQHVVTNQQVRLDGDTATCRSYLVGQHVKHGLADGENFIMAGTYTDRLVRTPAGWRIASRALEILWTEGNPAVIGRS